MIYHHFNIMTIYIITWKISRYTEYQYIAEHYVLTNRPILQRQHIYNKHVAIIEFPKSHIFKVYVYIVNYVDITLWWV